MTINTNEQPNYTNNLYLIQLDDPDMPLAKEEMKPLWERFVHLNRNKDTLIELFDLRYMFRELGAETVKRWFLLVKKRFMETARFYDHAFKILEENIDKMDEPGKEIVTEKLWDSGIRDRYQDTPVTPLTGEEYASSVNDRIRTGKDTEIKKDNTDMYIKEINDLINSYNDISMKWVTEFETLFMSTIMRI